VINLSLLAHIMTAVTGMDTRHMAKQRLVVTKLFGRI
jgi:hypothetical protein